LTSFDEDSSALKKAQPTIVLTAILLSFFLVYNPPLAGADAPLPALAVGDHWTYALTGTASGLSLSVTATITVVDAETVTVSGTTYNAYRLSISSAGSATSPTLTASVTESGYSLYRQSDQADIQDFVSTSFTFNGLTFTQIATSTNNPPKTSGQFPLSLNEAWTQTVTTLNNVTTINTSGVRSVSTYSNTTTTTYVVTSTPLTTVTAGTFDSYLIRSSDPTGTSETYYSPEVLQPIKVVGYNSTGSVTNTIQLQSYNAWPYSTPLTVNRSGTNYNVVVDTDVASTNTGQSPTTVTFQVNGTDGVTGRANVTIPLGLNNTLITVKVDTTITTATILKDSSNYYIYFNFPLSTHTITITYATAASATPLTTSLLYGGIAAAVAIVIIAALLLLHRRAKPAPEMPPATAIPPPPSTPPPGPPGDQPTSS
jgi:hypothetical protein